MIFGLIFITPFASVQAQNFELILTAKDSISEGFLKTISYNKKHISRKNVIREIDSVTSKINLAGFINNFYTINEKDSIITCTYTLNKQFKTIRIYYNSPFLKKNIVKTATIFTPSYFEIAFSDIQNTLDEIITHFENKGLSFTKASLSNLIQAPNFISATLNLEVSEKRLLNKIEIKGYKEFPKKYLKHYLGIQPNTLFNLNTIENIYKKLNTIPFISQIRKPEVLFTRDSTTLFIYLKKKSTNNFDGIVGFSNKENSSKIKFDGYIDLQLSNIFNKGESFKINWLNNSGNNKTLLLNFKSPFIFNSKFSLESSFSILKQDSSYVNTNALAALSYNINLTNTLKAIVHSEDSNTSVLESSRNEINAYKKLLFGISYSYQPTLNRNHYFEFDLSFLNGYRNMNNQNNTQQKFQLFTTYRLKFNETSSILLKSTNELLNSSNIVENEVFKIGGANSIRGFDELSINTSKYSLINFEYHHKLNNTSFLYTISDFALLNNNLTNTSSRLYGIGIGFSINTAKSIINMSYALGKHNKSPLILNNSKFHLKISYPF